jgi:hypothetical protein
MLKHKAVSLFLEKFGNTSEIRDIAAKTSKGMFKEIALDNLEDTIQIMKYNPNGSVYMPIVEEFDLGGKTAKCNMILVNYKEDLVGLYLGIGYVDVPENGTIMIINKENLDLLYPLV